MDLPENTVAAFATLGGATVALVQNEPLTTDDGLPGDRAGFLWTCLGCGSGSHYNRQRGHTRDQANDHAAACRSTPLPTP